VPPEDPVHVVGPLWLVVGEGQGRFPRSNSILIRDADSSALIDTGCGIPVLRNLADQIDLVINTHTHPDHSAGNFVFAGRPILVPEEGASTAGDLQALSERFFHESELRPVWRRFIREQMGWSNQTPTGTFGGEFKVGSTTLVAIAAPGHTVDHHCLFAPDHGALISADIDLTRFGPWYGHPESDLAQFRRSIEAVRALKPTVVISAHRPPVRGDDVGAALDRFAGVFDEREQRILSFLEQEQSWDEIVDVALIYGRFPYAPALMRSWEGEMARKHLDELVADGRVGQQGDRFRAV